MPNRNGNKVVRPGTAPKDLLIASGMFEGSCRADPVNAYLGALRLRLKVRRQLFDPVSQRGDALCHKAGFGGIGKRDRG